MHYEGFLSRRSTHTRRHSPSEAHALYERYLEELSGYLDIKVRGGADLETMASERLPVETL